MKFFVKKVHTLSCIPINHVPYLLEKKLQSISLCAQSVFDRLYGISTTIRRTAIREVSGSQHQGRQSRHPEISLQYQGNIVPRGLRYAPLCLQASASRTAEE